VEIAAAIAGLVAFSYLAFDLFYQTVPDIEVSSAETQSLFSLPFTVKTQSMIFTMHKTSFTCSFDAIVGNVIMKNNIGRFGGDLEIDRRNPGNYFCRNTIPAPSSAEVRIVPKYYTNLAGVYSWKRISEPSVFTWVSRANSGYWIKGKIGN
jgi:hypothetical protein